MSSEPTAAFSSSGEDAISRIIEVNQIHTRPNDVVDLDEFYEIQRTVDEINTGNYRRIALQFPDELLGDSVPIFRRLKAKLGPGRELYILADTSCCVDEVAAQHVDADALVHFGYACMSQTSRLPVIYVFGQKPIDIDDCVHQLVHQLELRSAEDDLQQKRTILLKPDVIYAFQVEKVAEKLNTALRSHDIIIQYNPIPTKAPPRVEPNDSDPRTSSTPHRNTIFYIGPESLALTNLLITNSTCDVISYNPITREARLESIRTNRMLMRRYAAVQKAKDADVFGILVGTLGVASYLPVIRHLRNLLARHHKKSYTLSVGKLNPSKLANFMEIECFVLVACPENSLIEAKDYLQPIVTPFELEVALSADPSWTGRYVLDFGQLLEDADGNVDSESQEKGQSEEADPDRPTFSLITGKYRHTKRYGGPQATAPEADHDPTSMIIRTQSGSLTVMPDSAAAHFLHQRTYQGLEVRPGEDEPSILEQGRSGIAREYQST